ncbi:MAG TPA: isochorismatase family cysteine hydrolase [Candidatus Binatia bacterium]|nr:isochorismatase family cysteine hydrolase [Candidatus Binatia bacterium]
MDRPPLLQNGSARRAAPARVALLVIDVVNPFDFEGADALLRHALPMAHRLAALKKRAQQAGVPIVYVNDNFDFWHLGLRELVEHFRRERVPGVPIIDLLAPEIGADFYILKPQHSGFFRTGLEVLLKRLEVETLVLTGLAGDICVLFTANDAYMRGFRVVVPSDCVASERAEDNEHALRHMGRLLKADTSASTDLDFDRLRGPIVSG